MIDEEAAPRATVERAARSGATRSAFGIQIAVRDPSVILEIEEASW